MINCCRSITGIENERLSGRLSTLDSRQAQHHRCQRRQRQFKIGRAVHPFAFPRLNAADIAQVAAAVVAGVAVQYFDVMAGARHAETVGILWHWGEVDRNNHKTAIAPPAQPGEDGMFAVVAVAPLKTLGSEILLMQGRAIAVEATEVG